MLPCLKQKLFLVKRLRDDGPGTAEAGGGDEVVVLEGCAGGGTVRGESGEFPVGVGGGYAALKHVDGRGLEGGDGRVFDPELFGKGLGGEGEGGAD